MNRPGCFSPPLDDRREWYRYHHLFQQFLQEQLQKRDPETSLALHRSAGRWFEQNGDWDDAIRHYLASSRYDAALQLIAKLPPHWLKAEWASLHAWLSAIPDAVLIARPRLYMMLIASMFLTGELAQATAKLSWAKAELEAGNIAEPQATAFRIGMEALHGLRAYIERNFADAARHLRQYMSLDPTGAFMSGIGTDDERFMPFWDVYTYIGGPQQAERFLGDLLQLWSLVEHQLFVAPIHSGYGKAMYELNRLSEAERYFRKVLDAGRTYANPTLLTSGSLWLARIQAALGNDDKAALIIRSLQQHVDETRFPGLAGKIALFQALQHLRRGNMQELSKWEIAGGLRWQDEVPLSMLAEYDLLACLLAETGRTTEAASLIERLLDLAANAQHQSDRIRFLLHKSMICWAQGDVHQSMDVLEDALTLAYPERYIRTFVDEGAPLATLLDEYIALRQRQHRRLRQRVPLPYVKKLRRLMHKPLPVGEPSPVPLLTAKEHSVLLHIEAGLTNREIADQLGISVSTVRTHINHLYSKLHADSRLQALERARELGML